MAFLAKAVAKTTAKALLIIAATIAIELLSNWPYTEDTGEEV